MVLCSNADSASQQMENMDFYVILGLHMGGLSCLMLKSLCSNYFCCLSQCECDKSLTEPFVPSVVP